MFCISWYSILDSDVFALIYGLVCHSDLTEIGPIQLDLFEIEPFQLEPFTNRSVCIIQVKKVNLSFYENYMAKYSLSKRAVQANLSYTRIIKSRRQTCVRKGKK